MCNDTLSVEIATHQTPKVALKIESLIQSMIDTHKETHPVIHEQSLNHCIELMGIIEKPELKSRFLKEFLRFEHQLNRSQTKISDDLYDCLYNQIQSLTAMGKNFTKLLSDDQFLQSIRRNHLSQNPLLSDFCPQRLYWQSADALVRREMIEEWLHKLYPLFKTVKTYLAVLRQTALFKTVLMDSGYYQQALPSSSACHIIILRIPKQFGAIPKINLSNYGLSLRLYHALTMQEMREQSSAFELALCQL